jgi:hypothetical protein
MNFIQTRYYDKSIDPLIFHFGWVVPEFHLMSWALSCLLLESVYGKIDSYCNSGPACLLIEKLGLPYNKTYVKRHEDFDLPDNNLWTPRKNITYSMQNEPFIHVDRDVFLVNKLPDYILATRLVSQNLEEASGYHLASTTQIEESLHYLPSCVRKDFNRTQSLKSLNTSIIGGNEYTRYYESLEVVPGEFYSVVVPEFFIDQCSIYDQDEMEKIRLDKLSTALTLGEFVYEMKEYWDDDVLSEHFEHYVDLVIGDVKQLVIKKVVRPETIQIFL